MCENALKKLQKGPSAAGKRDKCRCVRAVQAAVVSANVSANAILTPFKGRLSSFCLQ